MSDDLYYVKDTLSSKQGKLLDLNRWFLLGVRPLPVPSDWYNPDGQKLVLKFKTDTVKEFQMAWWTTNQQAAYPPGIKQIGSAGGTVELPGVAKLDLPAGALSAPTVVVMRQQKEVASRKKYCPNPHDPQDCALGWVFAAPIVKIEPLGLKLNQPAKLNLPIYDYFKRYDPLSQQDVATANILEPFSWVYFPYLAKRTDVRKFSDITHHNFPLWIQEFAYFSKQQHYTPSVDQFFESESFKIQSYNPTCQKKGTFQREITEHFYISDNDGEACPEAMDSIKKYLENAYSVYASWDMKAPPQFYSPTDLEETKIPVFIVEGFQDLLRDIASTTPQNANGVAYPIYKNNVYQGSAMQMNIEKDSLVGGRDFWGHNFADTSAHELFHIFQDAYLQTPEDDASIGDRWMFEGTAAYMGPFAVETRRADIGLEAIDPQVYSYYERVRSLEQLEKSFYYLRDYNENRSVYDTVPLWTHFANYYGPNGIAELFKEYGLNFRKRPANTPNTPRSTGALAAFLKKKDDTLLSDYFTRFATDAIIHKDICLFSSYSLPHVAFRHTHVVKANHTVQSPLHISTNGTEPLSAIYMLLQADKKILQPRNLYVRAISPDPNLTHTINQQARKVKEFLAPSLVGVNNLEGEAVKEITEASGKKRKPYISSGFAFDKSGHFMMPLFGQNQPVQSAILSVFNTLWETDIWTQAYTEKFTMNLEVFLGPKLISAEWPQEDNELSQAAEKGLPQLLITGTGFTPTQTEIVFEPRSGIDKNLKRKAHFLNSQADSDGVEIQKFVVDIPNEALRGGWVEGQTANIPSNRLIDATLACNMLPANASFSTAAQKPCPQ
ncbi:MAG: hypothetical protein AB7I41_01880 [Candidatus Sericytochromatia bacterium]